MVLSPAAESLLNALLLESSDGAREWNKWRAGADLEELDRDCLAVIPLLSGRLSAWFSQDSSKDPEREKFLGICKRGWAQNQIHFRELADVWTLLARGGADPIAIAGCAAWAQLYLEEKAVRPVQSLEILIRRDRAMPAKRILLSAGWSLEPGMPEPEGPILDEFEGLWFRSPMQTAVFLAWRLKKVSPEMAAEHEAVPLRRSFEVHGTALSVVETEELLFDALTREAETPVSWKCDSILLLRNRSVDWARLSSFFRDAPRQPRPSRSIDWLCCGMRASVPFPRTPCRQALRGVCAGDSPSGGWTTASKPGRGGNHTRGAPSPGT